MFKTILTLRQRSYYQALLRATHTPASTQAEVLKRIVDANKNTEFGCRHKFDVIHSVESYRERVPVHDFELLRADVETQRNSQRPTLTSEPVVLYNRTSGTTGAPKDIPLTQLGISETRQLSQLATYALMQQPSIFAGKIFAIGGAAIEGYTSNGTPIGSASGLIYRQQSRYVRRKYAIPPAVFDIEDNDTRYLAMAIYGLRENKVTTMATANPSTFIRLLDVIKDNVPELVQRIEQGTLPDTQARLPPIRPLPKRANQLSILFSQKQKVTYEDLWPNLKGVVVWCGGSCRFAVRKLRQSLSTSTKIIELGYSASEVRGTINVDVKKNLCLPSFQHNFFEFVTTEDWESDNHRFLGLHELKEQTEYYIFLTTSSGLYRYNINDVMRVSGMINETPTLEFVRKGHGVTNITGEKLTEAQVMAGMEQLCIELSIDPDFFVLLADEVNSSYLLCIEMQSAHSPTALVQQFDNILQQLNIEYESKRKSARLGSMRYHRLPAGAGYNYRSELIAAGQRDAQFKYQCLQYLSTTSLQLKAPNAVSLHRCR